MSMRWPLLLGTLVGLGALILALQLSLPEVEKWQIAARWTARVGFPLLIAAYVARPLVQLWPTSIARGLLARRKWVGLGFAVAHTIHLFALFTALEVAGRGLTTAQLLGGGGAYAIMYVMAFTSNRAAMKALGKWWKRIHLLGIHWLWFIFMQDYLQGIFEPEKSAYSMPAFLVAIAAAAIRFTAWQKVRRKRQAAKAI